MPSLNTSGAAPALVTVTLPPDADGKVGKLFLRPWGAPVRLAAVRRYWQAIEDTGDQSVGDVAYAVGAVRAAIAGWEGFDTDAEPGVDATFTPALVDGLELLIVENFGVYTAIQDQYVRPAVKEEAEKNASSLPRAGGSPAEAKTTPANPSSSASAAGTTAATPAKRSAKTARCAKPSSRRKAKASGK